MGKSGVSLTLFNTSTKINADSLIDPSYEHTFCMGQRKTKQDLISDYTKTIFDAQQTYINSVAKADKDLLLNIQECTKADNVLGAPAVPYVLTATSDKILENGSKHLQCPMIGCSCGTYKLRRHLTSVHPQLTEYQKNYAILLSKKMHLHSPTISQPRDSSDGEIAVKRKELANPNFAYKPLNPRQCPVCDKLLLNIGDHLNKVHHMPRSSEVYKSSLSDATVVPKCYIKVVKGETLKLEGDELRNAEASFGIKIDDQSRSLTTLKDLKSQMATIRKNMDETSNLEQYGSFKVYPSRPGG